MLAGDQSQRVPNGRGSPQGGHGFGVRDCHVQIRTVSEQRPGHLVSTGLADSADDRAAGLLPGNLRGVFEGRRNFVF
jgi:hypothetical protein